MLRKKHLIISLFVIIFLFFTISIFFTQKIHEIPYSQDKDKFNHIKTSSDDLVLAEGVNDPLNITDKAMLYDNQEIILTGQNEKNLSYYLADEWEATKIETTFINISDKWNWVENGNLFPIDTFTVNESYESTHTFSSQIEYDPTVPSNIQSNITVSGAIAIRVHFKNISFAADKDYLFMYNNNYTLFYHEGGNGRERQNFYSPWIKGNQTLITINSEGGTSSYGYYIDYYEFINGSSEYYNNSEYWNENSYTLGSEEKIFSGYGNIKDKAAMYTNLIGSLKENPSKFQAEYDSGDYIELYQNLSIPRGRAIDGSISFDFLLEFGVSTDQIIMYVEINDQVIYSKSFNDIVSQGKNQWFSTGKVTMDSWNDIPNVFDNALNNEDIKISLGIKTTDNLEFDQEEQGEQLIWFDNINLELTTLVNSTQSDINLTINNYKLIDSNEWGKSSLTLNETWTEDPILLSINSSSNYLIFDISISISLYHYSPTLINELQDEGISYEILENGTIYWEFLHNFGKPSLYDDFEIFIQKPKDWSFIQVLNPIFSEIPFEGGTSNDNYLLINDSYTINSGTWRFKATSPNYINISNTKLWKNGVLDNDIFLTGDDFKVSTQINFSGYIPGNLEETSAKLTMVFPNGTIWYQESYTVGVDGYVNFTELSLTSDLLAGVYNFTIFWNNGTSLGGIRQNLILKHYSNLVLNKPTDAISDLTTEAFSGDIIPLRVIYKDSENQNFIPNADLTLNWTKGNYSDYTLIRRSSDSYPSSVTDGTLVYNNTGNGTVDTSLDQAYLYTFWAYNSTENVYSDPVFLNWSASWLDCYNETNQNNITDWKVEIVNNDGSEVYVSENNNNSHIINISDLPSGNDVTFTFSADGYHLRTYTRDVTDVINLDAYLIPEQDDETIKFAAETAKGGAIVFHAQEQGNYSLL